MAEEQAVVLELTALTVPFQVTRHLQQLHLPAAAAVIIMQMAALAVLAAVHRQLAAVSHTLVALVTHQQQHHHKVIMAVTLGLLLLSRQVVGVAQVHLVELGQVLSQVQAAQELHIAEQHTQVAVGAAEPHKARHLVLAALVAVVMAQLLRRVTAQPELLIQVEAAAAGQTTLAMLAAQAVLAL